MTSMAAAMTTAVRVTSPEPGPLPKAIGKGPMKTTPPTVAPPEPRPPSTMIAKPTKTRTNPSR
jgi:hypothetical protein